MQSSIVTPTNYTMEGIKDTQDIKMFWGISIDEKGQTGLPIQQVVDLICQTSSIKVLDVFTTGTIKRWNKLIELIEKFFGRSIQPDGSLEILIHQQLLDIIVIEDDGLGRKKVSLKDKCKVVDDLLHIANGKSMIEYGLELEKIWYDQNKKSIEKLRQKKGLQFGIVKWEDIRSQLDYPNFFRTLLVHFSGERVDRQFVGFVDGRVNNRMKQMKWQSYKSQLDLYFLMNWCGRLYVLENCAALIRLSERNEGGYNYEGYMGSCRDMAMDHACKCWSKNPSIGFISFTKGRMSGENKQHPSSSPQSSPVLAGQAATAAASAIRAIPESFLLDPATGQYTPIYRGDSSSSSDSSGSEEVPIKQKPTGKQLSEKPSSMSPSGIVKQFSNHNGVWKFEGYFSLLNSLINLDLSSLSIVLEVLKLAIDSVETDQHIYQFQSKENNRQPKPVRKWRMKPHQSHYTSYSTATDDSVVDDRTKFVFTKQIGSLVECEVQYRIEINRSGQEHVEPFLFLIKQLSIFRSEAEMQMRQKRLKRMDEDGKQLEPQ